MTNPVHPDRIESIVGAPRHPTKHIGRAVSAEGTVYILHSQACFDREPDLRACPYSLALDKGIDPDEWPQDTPVPLRAFRVERDWFLLPDDRPKNPRTFDAMLRAAFRAGGAWMENHACGVDTPPEAEAYAEWRATLLPDPEGADQ